MVVWGKELGRIWVERGLISYMTTKQAETDRSGQDSCWVRIGGREGKGIWARDEGFLYYLERDKQRLPTRASIGSDWQGGSLGPKAKIELMRRTFCGTRTLRNTQRRVLLPADFHYIHPRTAAARAAAGARIFVGLQGQDWARCGDSIMDPFVID
jgi:hypothetical protein